MECPEEKQLTKFQKKTIEFINSEIDDPGHTDLNIGLAWLWGYVSRECHGIDCDYRENVEFKGTDFCFNGTEIAVTFKFKGETIADSCPRCGKEFQSYGMD